MRWKGIIVFGVLLVLIVGFWWFFSDGIVKGAIESIGASANGAKVEIKDLHFSLLKMSIHINGLQMADPNDEWKNQLEVRDMRFKLNPLPLLYGKINIEEMAAEGIVQDAKRVTSGKLPIVKVRPVTTTEEAGWLDDLSQSISQEAEDIPVAKALSGKDKLDFSQIFTPERLTALAEIAHLDIELNNRISDTTTTLNNLNVSARLDAIKKQYNEIDFKEKNPVKLVKELKKAKNIKEEADKLSKELKQAEETVKANYEFAKDIPGQIDGLKEKDYQAIINNIGEIKGLDKSGVSRLLLGPDCLEQAKTWMHWVRKISKLLPKKSAEEKIKKVKGTDIEFPIHKSYPGFLVKKINITVEDAAKAGELMYQGTVEDICSDPGFYGKPTLLTLKGAQNDTTVNGIFDHTTKVGHDSLRLSLTQDLKGFALSKTSYFPQRIFEGRAQVKASIVMEDDMSEISLNILPKDIIFNNADVPDNELAKAIAGAITSAKDMAIDAVISIGRGRTTFKVDSNIDNAIAQAVKNLIYKKIGDIKAEAKQKIDGLVDGKKDELLGKVQAAKDGNEKLLNEKITEVKQLSQSLESKIKIWDK